MGLTPAEAQRWVLDEAPVLAAETVTTPEGRGRVLAEAVVSSRCLPPSDNSAMDGYAVRRADLGQAGASVALRVAFEVPAGAAVDRALASADAATS